MKINKSAIAILLAATLCFTSVAPALAAETSGEDSVVTAVSEELNNEGFTEGEEKDNSDSGNPENSENEQRLENSSDNTSNNSNGDSDAANEISTEEIAENEAVEETADGISEEIGETAAKANTAEETAAVEEPSEIDISDEAKAATTFAGGSGTQSDPYKVSNAAQLNAVRNYPEAYFIQTADINMSSISNWEPIGKDNAHCFQGGYDGKGHTISNLNIKNGGSETYIGLFGFVSHEIKNLNLENASIVIDLSVCGGSIQVGTLAGNAPAIKCSARGTIKITGSDRYGCSIGGLIGRAQVIDNCHGEVSITVNCNGNQDINVGGLAGECLHGPATDSYFKGAITTSGDCVCVGGIVGKTDWCGGVSNCVNYGDISVNNESAGSTVAGIVGIVYTDDNTESVENCVNFGNITGSDEAFVVGITRADGITVHNCYDLGNIEGNSYSGRIYTADARNVISYSNYGYGNATVNGIVPTGGLLPSGFNGMNMSAEDIRINISDILDSCGGEWVEPASGETRIVAEGFNIPNDVFNFKNSSKDFGVNAHGAYPIDARWYIFFQNHHFTSSEVRAVIKDTLTWGGCCGGMSSVVMQNYKNMINLKALQSNADVLNDLTRPADNNNIQTFIGINHFGLQTPGYFILQNDFQRQYNGASALRYLYNLALDIQNTNKMIFVDFAYCNDITAFNNDNSKGGAGHAIVVYGMETAESFYNIEGERFKYRLLTINPNIIYNKDDIAADFCIYISENFDKCVIPKSGTRADNIGSGKLCYCGSLQNIKHNNDFFFQFITNDVNKVLPVGRSGETDNDKYYVFDGKIPWIYVNINGQKLSSSPKVNAITYLPEDNDGGHCRALLEKGDYSIETEAEGEFSIYTGESYVEYNSVSGGEIQFIDDNGLLVNSPSQFSVTITSDELPVVNEDVVSLTFDGEYADNLQIDYSNGDEIKILGDIGKGTKISCESIDKETVYTYTVEEDMANITVHVSDEIQIEDVQDDTIIASGSCGENLTYTVAGTGDNLTLTISGEGDMYDYAYFDSYVQTAHSAGDLPLWVSDDNIRKNIKRIIVKEGVTGIGSGAFSYVGAPQFGTKARINGIKLPRSLRRIGWCAFYNTGCDTITIGSPNNPVKMEFVNPRTGQLLKGNGLVRSNFRKVNICLDDTFGEDFQYSAVESVTFIEGTEVIPAACFENCNELQSVKLAKSVTTVAGRAFESCHNLSKVEFPTDGNLETIGRFAFQNCNNLKTITLPESLNIIEQNAFENCTSIENLDIPDSVETIYYSAFKGCTGLQTVKLSSGITKIPNRLFSGCENIESIAIPNSVIEIDSLAFQGCKKLTRIEIPASVSNIVVEYNYIMNTTSAFAGAEKLAEIAVDPNNATYKSYDGCLYNSDLTELLYCPEGKESIIFAQQTTTVTASAFRCGDSGGGKSKLKELNFKTCAPDISENAFGVSSITATAYYNNYLNTWSPEKCQNYGGQITWAEKALDLSDCNMTISPTSYSYNGTAKKPAVSLNYGEKKLALNTDYTIVYKNNTNAGKATVTATGNGYFTGTAAKTFTIKKIANTITAKSFTRTYSTKAQVFSLGVKIKKGTPTYKSNSKYVVVSKAGKVTVKAKFIGKATITITAPASTNYTATTKKITITVNPTKTALSSVTSPSAGKMTVKWKKNAVGTGYLFQYSTASTFKNVKTVWITNNATVSRTVSGLAKGKKYYVRIRTYKKVGSAKFYSGWSAAKAVTVKK